MPVALTWGRRSVSALCLPPEPLPLLLRPAQEGHLQSKANGTGDQ
ncbi:hypothetical protein SLNWT_5597 [Streptomyces albus]|uniref:Uncharacterized protein n=1 Tax=Streptomyces albus (strain ATCC 21838 / DSM 41398 / FERM P-419 / JCM 4703 / NBRC 107858) TaxID=1081613 RepID=A0A0B5ET22_STRA4|nr:hypothetical protein SLNWT_5597 [Streptomyces albus]AOU80275.1 hypothetical protein SLNHY_5584 [Streptomyces albus]AYN35989.1 hypothetical protein DUI70_5493 [Streptomyces albus]